MSVRLEGVRVQPARAHEQRPPHERLVFDEGDAAASCEESLEDAAAAANMLGVKIDTVPIGPAMNAFDEMLLDHFKGSETGITEDQSLR